MCGHAINDERMNGGMAGCSKHLTYWLPSVAASITIRLPYKPPQQSGYSMALASSHAARPQPGHPTQTGSIRCHLLRFEIVIPESCVCLSLGEEAKLGAPAGGILSKQ